MASSKLAIEFKAKIASAIKSDTRQRDFIGFINKRIVDQRGLLDCLWEFSMNFSADWARLPEDQKQRGRALLYVLFSRAITLAGPMNELADFVLYVDGLARQSRGGKKDKWQLRPPASEATQQYVVYQSRWSQMPEKDQNELRQKARQKRQELRDRRTLIAELMNAYRKQNANTPTLEELFDFDPAPKTPRKEFDKAVKACETAWRQFSGNARPLTSATEENLKGLDSAFEKLRELLLKAENEPLAFYQMWKWIRDGRQRKVLRGRAWEGYQEENVVPVLPALWSEMYLDACYCAMRLANGKWNMWAVQQSPGIHPADRDFLLGPVNKIARENFETRLKWGVDNTVAFEELNRLRRRMNRFGEAAPVHYGMRHLDEFETVALANKIAQIQQTDPARMENMVVQASSVWVAFRDKHRIGQSILDSFTIVWQEQTEVRPIFVEFHNLPYQIFAVTSHGLGDMVRNAVWQKMRELGDQIVRFLLVYLEVVGLVVDVISAGTTGGFRQIAFRFIKERLKDKATDAVLDAFHIENQAVRVIAGMGANLVRVPKAKVKADIDARSINAGVPQAEARGLATGAAKDTRAVAIVETKGIANIEGEAAKQVEGKWFDRSTTVIEAEQAQVGKAAKSVDTPPPRPRQQQIQQPGGRRRPSPADLQESPPPRLKYQHQQTQQQQQQRLKRDSAATSEKGPDSGQTSKPTKAPDDPKATEQRATAGKHTEQRGTTRTTVGPRSGDEWVKSGRPVKSLPPDPRLSSSAATREFHAGLEELAEQYKDPLLKKLLAAQGTERDQNFKDFILPDLKSAMPPSSVFSSRDWKALEGALKLERVPWRRGTGPDLILIDLKTKRAAILDLTSKPSISHGAKTLKDADKLRSVLPSDWTIEIAKDFYHSKGFSKDKILDQLMGSIVSYGYKPRK